MIDYEDFKGMCERLARVTGRVDEDTRRIYWDSLKDHDRDTVFRAMRRVGKEHGFYKFPTIAEIMDAIRDCADSRKGAPAWCEKCNMTGFVLAEKDGYTNAYRCDCQNGMRISRAIRPFSQVEGFYEGKGEPDHRPVIKFEALDAIDDGYLFKDGLVVEKTCGLCWKPYKFEHHRKIMAKDVKEIHQPRPSVCMDCYIEDGRKKGLWK